MSTAGLGGGQESTVMNTLSTLAHHGIIYVPLGYSRTFSQLTNVDEVHGGVFGTLQYSSHAENAISRFTLGGRNLRIVRWNASTLQARARDCGDSRILVL